MTLTEIEQRVKVLGRTVADLAKTKPSARRYRIRAGRFMIGSGNNDLKMRTWLVLVLMFSSLAVQSQLIMSAGDSYVWQFQLQYEGSYCPDQPCIQSGFQASISGFDPQTLAC